MTEIPDLEEVDPMDPESDNFKHEHTIILAIMAMGLIIFTVFLYMFVGRQLFNSYTTFGTFAAVLVFIFGWVPGYWVYFRVLRPLFKEVYK